MNIFFILTVIFVLVDVGSDMWGSRNIAKKLDGLRSQVRLMLLLHKLDMKSPGKAQHKLIDEIDRVRLWGRR